MDRGWQGSSATQPIVDGSIGNAFIEERLKVSGILLLITPRSIRRRECKPAEAAVRRPPPSRNR